MRINQINSKYGLAHLYSLCLKLLKESRKTMGIFEIY
jgi:hypothetical protein|uniref:Uncharacterized protein n=1 Tax=Populus trichocarpa TaxID=3694 RepID=A0A3N7GBP4_POPTR